MIRCPNHIQNVVVDASKLFSSQADDYHHYFQIICPCGAILFYLFFGTKRSVHAICHQCLHDITVYDLAEYPAATKSKGQETFVLLKDILGPSKVFVAYEYGQLDDDQQFDPNDISWCEVFVEIQGGSSAIKKVFDDETS